MSRLACAACGAEDQIATVVLPAGTNAATQALAGLVERVTFHNEENGFCVLRVKARGQTGRYRADQVRSSAPNTVGHMTEQRNADE